jgi:hypothetical protein
MDHSLAFAGTSPMEEPSYETPPGGRPTPAARSARCKPRQERAPSPGRLEPGAKVLVVGPDGTWRTGVVRDVSPAPFGSETVEVGFAGGDGLEVFLGR